MIIILDQNSHYDFYWVYIYLEANKIEQPNRFLAPINNSISKITAELREVMKDPYKEAGVFEYLDLELLCRVLDQRFKENRAVFLPNILKLQEILETTPVERNVDKEIFMGRLNINRLAVKNWLHSR